ncbi:ankyrin repeat-containing protein At2g01680-like isoform X2 [Rhododendron vialii]|uniref:ankyrin repeat-containing protein At2g01680-like isoform X2 n=1 Tax=Rhododendron vialii TaxID=182163 RepID=UPI00265E8709|nr:ankyrin repeat-containing protein At2g01680-like isoform X2 [Rhododendron vialii]
MAERLNEAEINENPTSLHDENEYNLDRAMVKCFNWTPLHVAASRGQQELFQELLHRNPELAKALDSQQQSLLHLASANGHIEIVKALTQVRPEMCLARDRDGANPLHVAAMRGKVEIVKALIQVRPEMCLARDRDGANPLHVAAMRGNIEIVKALIQVRPEMCLARDRDGANPLHVAAMRGKVKVLDALFKANPHAARARVESGERETILHLCVKYNQPYFLSILLEKYFKCKEFVNAKDNADNTILHLAVADRKKEIIEYVLSHTEIDVNAINASKQTAKDILLHGQKKGTNPEGVDKEIQGLLKSYHAKRVMDGIFDPTQIAEKKNGIIVAAVLMATLAFQAGVTPPGGVWQDDSEGHKSGEAVMAYNHPFLFWYFSGFNIIGFVTSLVTIILIVIEVPFKKRAHLLLIASLMGATIVSIAITYLISLAAVAPGPKLSNRTVLRIGGISTIISVSIVAASFLLCMIARTVRKRKSRNNAVDPASENEANV